MLMAVVALVAASMVVGRWSVEMLERSKQDRAAASVATAQAYCWQKQDKA
jgi:hypothetical protein